MRAIDPFRKFLPVAAQSHGRPLNYSKIGRQAGVDPKSVERYFSILEDTLVGTFLDSFHTSIRSRQKLAPKFYFFDVGVQRALAETLDVKISPMTSYFGEMFEAFVISEAMRLANYSNKLFKLSYFQTHDGFEVDLVVEQSKKVIAFIEIKSATSVDVIDLQSLKRLQSEFPETRRICLCRESLSRTTDEGIEIFPWHEGLKQIFL